MALLHFSSYLCRRYRYSCWEGRTRNSPTVLVNILLQTATDFLSSEKKQWFLSFAKHLTLPVVQSCPILQNHSLSTNYSLESVELLLTYKLCFKVNTKLYTGRISPVPSLPLVSRRSPSFIGMSKSYSSCLWENNRTVFIAIQTMDPYYANKIQCIYATLHDSLAQYLTMRVGGGWLWGVCQLLQSHHQAAVLVCPPMWLSSVHERRHPEDSRRRRWYVSCSSLDPSLSLWYSAWDQPKCLAVELFRLWTSVFHSARVLRLWPLLTAPGVVNTELSMMLHNERKFQALNGVNR